MHARGKQDRRGRTEVAVAAVMGEEEVAAAAVAELFASRPRSFRMDRRSAEAAKLKATVSRKLVEFLGNYTDDVLAEYIVVLVCNGKHQNQASADLEAFLGDDSEKFVAWLWHHLSEETSLVDVPTHALDQKADAMAVHSGDVSKEQKNGTLTDLRMQSIRTSDIPLSKEGKHGFSNSFSVLNSECGPKESEEVPKRRVGSAVVNNDLREHVCRIERSCGPKDGNNSDSMAYKSARVHALEASVGNEQALHLENSYKKIGSCRSNDTPCELPKQEPNVGNLRSVHTEDSYLRQQSLMNVASGRLSTEVTDSRSHQNMHPRGSVWDRLGKPREDTKVLVNERMHQLGLDAGKRGTLDHIGEGFDKRRLASPVSARLGKRIFSETTSVQNSHVSPTSSDVAVEHNEMGSGHDKVYSPKKRLFGEKDPRNGLKALSDHRDHHLEDKETHERLQGSSAANGIPKQSLKRITAENRLPSETAKQSSKSVKLLHNLRPNENFQLQARLEISVPNSAQDPASVGRSAQSKTDSLSNPEHVAASHKPVEDEVLDMKQRLHQIERKMLELRSKQTSMNIDSKAMAVQVSSLKNYPEQDADARTVFVTNVHFAAPKEALSSHFAQCGTVVRVVLLTDTITGQPKGSAYIVFANKESADKAISLNGTSFFSRKLEVMRKADMPAGALAPNQVPGRPPRPWPSPQSHGKSPFQRQVSGHLQWRRDQSSGGSGDNSPPAPATHRLETSGAAE